MATLLIKHKTILKRYPEHDIGAAVCFVQEIEGLEAATPIKAMFLSIELWQEMNCPVEISVTVEPGDTMNHSPMCPDEERN